MSDPKVVETYFDVCLCKAMGIQGLKDKIKPIQVMRPDDPCYPLTMDKLYVGVDVQAVGYDFEPEKKISSNCQNSLHVYAYIELIHCGNNSATGNDSASGNYSASQHEYVDSLHSRTASRLLVDAHASTPPLHVKL